MSYDDPTPGATTTQIPTPTSSIPTFTPTPGVPTATPTQEGGLPTSTPVSTSKKIPLGGDSSIKADEVVGKIYVPTKWGGTLTVGSNVSLKLYYTDGSDLTSSLAEQILNEEIMPVAYGSFIEYTLSESVFKWFYVKADGEAMVDIWCYFGQVAEASKRPWNFYYWPTCGDHIHDGGNQWADTEAAPGDLQLSAYNSAIDMENHLGIVILAGIDGTIQTTPTPDDIFEPMINLTDLFYGMPGPLWVYDSYSPVTSARQTELANNEYSLAVWDGYCLGGAVASIMLNQPAPIPEMSEITQDGLEGLWAKLGSNFTINLREPDVNSIPVCIPHSGSDISDNRVGEVHFILEKFLMGEFEALLSNLRAEYSDPVGQESVWNHAIWKYEADYAETELNNEKIVEITNVIHANVDTYPSINNSEERVIQYVYIVEYDDNGEVDRNSQHNNWLEVSGQAYSALETLGCIQSVSWIDTQNPEVVESKVRTIDAAN